MSTQALEAPQPSDTLPMVAQTCKHGLRIRSDEPFKFIKKCSRICNLRAVPELLRVCAPLAAAVVHGGQVCAPELGVGAAVGEVAVALDAGRVALVAREVVPACGTISSDHNW
jgi:hypothetical protein